jgi:ectoine hydroxylase-related dioxygenase (phytanoyl-CoA dioxygenase family)
LLSGERALIVDPKKIEEINDVGYTLVEGAIDLDYAAALKPALMAAAKEELQDYKDNKYKPDPWVVHNLMTRGSVFLPILENKVMHAYLDALLGNTCITYAYGSSILPPHDTNYANRIHTDCPPERIIPNYITNVVVLFALDDFTSENGGTWFLPRSQWDSTCPSTEDFYAKAVQINCKAGDIAVFNAHTWHAAGVNKTDQYRASCAITGVRSFMRQRFDYPRMMTPDALAELGDVGRRFLGYNVRMPTSFEQFYLPEAQRLYRSNQG